MTQIKSRMTDFLDRAVTKLQTIEQLKGQRIPTYYKKFPNDEGKAILNKKEVKAYSSIISLLMNKLGPTKEYNELKSSLNESDVFSDYIKKIKDSNLYRFPRKDMPKKYIAKSLKIMTKELENSSNSLGTWNRTDSATISSEFLQEINKNEAGWDCIAILPYTKMQTNKFSFPGNDVEIRKINPEERVFYINKEDVSSSPPIFRPERETAVINTQKSVDLEDCEVYHREVEKCTNLIDDVLDCIEIFGSFKRRQERTNVYAWPNNRFMRLEPSSLFNRRTRPEAGLNISKNLFSDEKKEKIISGWRKYKRYLRGSNESLNRAIERFRRIKAKKNPSDSLLDCAIGFEVTLRQGHGNTAQRGTVLLENPNTEPKKIYDFFNKFWEVRNNIIHEGESIERVSLNGESIYVQDFIDMSSRFLRKVIKEYMSLMDSNHDQSIGFINQNILDERIANRIAKM